MEASPWRIPLVMLHLPPLESLINVRDDPLSVWPSSCGSMKGLEFSPLYRSVPEAIRNDSTLYELLADSENGKSQRKISQ